ncbi:MAG: hypothetical protein L6Q55_11450 [Azonexus sp.]|nr:hypothetical protein [Azonexus sp.]MCK6413024.1 hypothetical protein [Azonexus sp.]
MNANKHVFGLVFALAILPFGAEAVQNLGASGQTKVNNAMAKRWSEQQKGQNTPTQEKRVVNVGSRRGGDCSVNVGTAQAGQGGRQPKDIVVTTKEVINVCR